MSAELLELERWFRHLPFLVRCGVSFVHRASSMICILLVAGHGTVLETQIKVSSLNVATVMTQSCRGSKFALVVDLYSYSHGMICQLDGVVVGQRS